MHFKTFFKKIPPSSAIGIIISAVLLWLLIKESSLEWQELISSINTPVSGLYILGAMLFFGIMVYIQSIRTRVIFVDQHHSVKDISAYPSLIIGNLYSCLLPGNLGEGVRAWHFSKVNNRAITSSLAVFITEKILAAITVFPFFLFVLIYFPFIGHYVQFTFLFLVLFITLVVVTIIILFQVKTMTRFIFGVVPFSKLRKALFKIFMHFQHHIKRMWQFDMLKYFLGISYFMYFINVIQYYLILEAVQLTPELLNLGTAAMLSLALMIVMIIPSAPGNIGVAHYGIYLILIFMAELKNIEVTPLMQQKFAITGICLHFSYYVPEILIGLIYLLKDYKRVFQFSTVKI